MGRSNRFTRSIFPNSTLFATLLVYFYSVSVIAESSWQRLQDDGEKVGARCESDYGKLRGFVASNSRTSQQVNVFLKVPFAKPPVAELRFEVNLLVVNLTINTNGDIIYPI